MLFRSMQTSSRAVIEGGPDNYLGSAVAHVGDLDGDGTDDIAVGADRDDDGGNQAGAVYIFDETVSGTFTVYLLDTITSGSQSLSGASGQLTGQHTGDNLGSGLASGDFNGDGLSDVAVGAYDESSAASYAGQVYVFDGPAARVASVSAADASFPGESANDAAGWAVSGGDTDDERLRADRALPRPARGHLRRVGRRDGAHG